MVVRVLLCCFAIGALAGCSFDWDGLDPRLGGAGGSTASSGGGGSGGEAGAGGHAGGTAGGGGQGGSALGPWSEPVLVDALSSPADDDDPSFTADLLELYFNSNRSGNSEVWRATRSSPTAPWGNLQPAVALNSPAVETNVVVAADGLSVWLSSNRDGQSDLDIYVSTRQDRSSPWATPALVAELSTSGTSDFMGAVSGDGLHCIIDNAESGTPNMYQSVRSGPAAPWAIPVPIAELNSGESDQQAWLSADRTVVYFDSNRDGELQIYRASRADPSQAWTAPQLVAELSSPLSDSDAWLSPDRRYVMLTRGFSSDPREIYEASR